MYISLWWWFHKIWCSCCSRCLSRIVKKKTVLLLHTHSAFPYHLWFKISRHLLYFSLFVWRLTQLFCSTLEKVWWGSVMAWVWLLITSHMRVTEAVRKHWATLDLTHCSLIRRRAAFNLQVTAFIWSTHNQNVTWDCFGASSKYRVRSKWDFTIF